MPRIIAGTNQYTTACDDRRTVQVPQNDVRLADWPPVTDTPYLVTGGLNSCTGVAIISPQAAILAHIAVLPDGTTEIVPETDPGRAHVLSIVSRMTQLYRTNEMKFSRRHTFVIAGIWNEQPAMAEGIRIIDQRLRSLGLRPEWKSYPVLMQEVNRPVGFTSVVIEAPRPGDMPKVYLNNRQL